MIKILSTNISEKRGTIKIPVDSITLNELGIAEDSHSGSWHRQISILSAESIRRFEKKANRKIKFGEFAENITLEGMEVRDTLPLDRFIFGRVILEVTQIGKVCHGDSCEIFKEVGACVMPKEGIFCRVISHGVLKAGDEGIYQPRVIRTLVITLSDRAYSGEYDDRSGPAIEKDLVTYFDSIGRRHEVKRLLIPDDGDKLKTAVETACPDMDFIFTTGGTGIGRRDITPDVVKPMLEKEIPGIMELIRIKYGMEKPNALLSRGVAGYIGDCCIFTLPGSVRAVNEYMQEIKKSLNHLMYMRHQIDTH